MYNVFLHIAGRTNKLVDACYSFWQAGAVVVSKMIRLGLADTFDADEVETATDVDTTDGYYLYILSIITLLIVYLFLVFFLLLGAVRIVELDGSGTRIHLATEDGGGFEYNQFALQSKDFSFLTSMYLFVYYTLTMCTYMFLEYILQCGQTTKGGLRDKPSKGRDFYHSCYALSGLSIAQYYDLDVEGRSHDIFVYGDVDNVIKFMKMTV